MTHQTYSGSSRAVFCLSLAAALLAAPRAASATQDPALYFICEVHTRGVSPGTTYLSDVIGPLGLMLNNKSVITVLNEEFQKFVADKYSLNANAACMRYMDEDNARKTLKQRVAVPPRDTKVVETHWKHAASPAAVGAASAPAPAPAPQQAKPAASGAAFHGFCSANFPGSIGYNKTKPTYFTPIFGFPRDGNYGAWFGEWVAKKYSFQPWPAASW